LHRAHDISRAKGAACPADKVLRMPSPPLRLAVALLLGAAIAGCGKSLPAAGLGRGAEVATVAGTRGPVAVGVATKNTTRLGGANPVEDAAAVALATNPGLTPATRPRAVVIVDDRDWPAALAAAALAGEPLNAPLLYSEGATLPELSAQALATMRPTGAAALGGAKVIDIGAAAPPAGYPARVVSGASGGGGAGEVPADTAAQIERLVEAVHGGPPRRVIVVGADGPPALAMPAAGLAAESGAPVLPVYASGVPPATREVLARLNRPTIYAVGSPAAVSHAVLLELKRYGPVRRIYAGAATVGEGAAKNAIAVARFAEGPFGWAIEQPGHGLVFALASRPLDAPAAAALSASGEYAPLLLLERPGTPPGALKEFLENIRPGYNTEYSPVKGAYNHGWLIGDERAITAKAQAELDGLLEIAPTIEPAAPPKTAP
jgi:ell wall binding domain 2 (CWB2)